MARFKQEKNIFKQYTGKNILEMFVDNTDEWKNGDATVCQNQKNGSFNQWISFIYIKNADMRKYGMMLSKLQSNYAMGHDNYSKTLAAATNQLINHRYDNYSKKKKKP